MSVMSCSRTGCDNIMCDTYVSGIGYICNECQEEFKLCMSRGGSLFTDVDIIYELRSFMYSEKGTYREKYNEIINDFFASRTN